MTVQTIMDQQTAPSMPWAPDTWLFNPFITVAARPDATADQAASMSAPDTVSPIAAALSIATQNVAPWLKACTDSHCEVIDYMSRRGQSLLAMPMKISRCTTSHDFVDVHVQFWQTAIAQQSDTAARLAAAWGCLSPTAADMACALAPAPIEAAMPVSRQATDAVVGDVVARPADRIKDQAIAGIDRPITATDTGAHAARDDDRRTAA